jgi:hypothetical protein
MNGRMEEGRDGRVGGEFHSCYESCKQAGQITEEEYEKLDQLHYRVENELLRLMGSLQKKQTVGDWEDTL